MKTTILLLLWIANVAYSFHLEFPLTPDDIRWAGKTCAYESKPSEELRRKWRNWDLSAPVDEKTKCHVKCAMEYTGLYDRKSKKINSAAIQKQFKGRGLPDPVKLDLLDGTVDNTCSAVFNRFMSFLPYNAQNYVKAFWGDPKGAREEAKQWYKDHPDKKNIGVKASDFCAKQYKDNACEIVHCKYYYYRLVDSAHKVIKIRNMNVYADKGLDDYHYKKCQKDAADFKGCEVSRALWRCMIMYDKESWNKFEAFLDDVSADNEYPKA